MVPWVNALAVQAEKPEFNPWNLQNDERRKPTPQNCPPTSTRARWHMCAHTHATTTIMIMILKDKAQNNHKISMHIKSLLCGLPKQVISGSVTDSFTLFSYLSLNRARNMSGIWVNSVQQFSPFHLTMESRLKIKLRQQGQSTGDQYLLILGQVNHHFLCSWKGPNQDTWGQKTPLRTWGKKILVDADKNRPPVSLHIST